MKSPPYRNVFKHSSSTKTFSPLACLHLSTAQYHSVQKQYTSLAISFMGYNRTWSNSLRYRDYQYCRPNSNTSKQRRSSGNISSPHTSVQTPYLSTSVSNISLVSTCSRTFLSSSRPSPFHHVSYQQPLAR